MWRGLLYLMLAIVCRTTLAQQPPANAPTDPIVRTTLEPSAVTPGQSATLKVTALVPTWMPNPAVLPGFDLPNLMVKLPDRATRPVSERIRGKMWSGVTRTYQIYPLVAGEIPIPPQTLTLSYADPKTYQTATVQAQTDALVLVGAVPAAAQDLQPFLAASALTMTQEVDGATGTLEPGDAVSRSVSVAIAGAPPMMVPALLSDAAVAGLSIHAEAPEVTDDPAKPGELAGRRTERQTIIVENGGRYTLPAVQLRWYNLHTDAVEIATVESIDLAVEGPRRRLRVSVCPTGGRLWLRSGSCCLPACSCAACSHLSGPLSEPGPDNSEWPSGHRRDTR